MSTHLVAGDCHGWVMPGQLLVKCLTSNDLFAVGWDIRCNNRDKIKTDIVKDGEFWKIILYNENNEELFYAMNYAFSVDDDSHWWIDNVTKQIGSMHYLGFLPDIWCNNFDELIWEPYMLLYNGQVVDWDNIIGYRPVGLYYGDDYEGRFKDEGEYSHWGSYWGAVCQPVYENGKIKIEIIRKFEEKRD